MLKKLFSHDFSAMGKPMLLFTLITVLSTILGTAAMRCLPLFVVQNNSILTGIMSGACGLVIFASILVIIAYAVMTVIIILRRFYTNFYTDEGYLTFTLPAKAGTQLFSKALSGYIWSLIGGVAVIFCIFVMVMFGTAEKGLINMDIIAELKKILPQMFAYGETWELLVWITLFILTVTAYGLLLMFLAITLGSIIAKKHKILAAIGLYYGINFAAGLVMIVISIIAAARIGAYDFNISISASETIGVAMSTGRLILIGFITLYLAFAVAAYFINRRLIDKKLNLA